VAFGTKFDIAYDTLQNARESEQVLTVSEVNARAKKRLESDPALRRIWVRGEVSTWTVQTKRNPYAFFTLRDETSQLSGVIWNDVLSQLSRHPEKGETVRVRGSIGVYAVRGVYQIQAEELIIESGAGALWQRYEQTKRKLEAEGLFAAERKRPLPRFPRQVGLITSLEGAVLHDIVRIARERHAGIPIVVFSVSVQGEGAPASLIAALALANSPAVAQQVGALDVLILARGAARLKTCGRSTTSRSCARSPTRAFLSSARWGTRQTPC
jgi:exodeoxyribonuclease VII large subunit